MLVALSVTRLVGTLVAYSNYACLKQHSAACLVARRVVSGTLDYLHDGWLIYTMGSVDGNIIGLTGSLVDACPIAGPICTTQSPWTGSTEEMTVWC